MKTYVVQHLTDPNGDIWQSRHGRPITDRMKAILFAADSASRIGGTWRVLDDQGGLAFFCTGLSGRDRTTPPVMPAAVATEAVALADSALDLALELAGKLARLQSAL